jgi:hypothetical protein
VTARGGAHVVAFGIVLAGLVLVGCADPARVDRTETPQDALARVQGVTAKVTEARSARLSMTMRTIFAGEDIAANTVTTQGVYDYASHKGQMDTTIKQAGIPAMMAERTLIIGSTVYTKLPEGPGAPGGPATPGEHHKPWTKLELPKELAGQHGFWPALGPTVDGGGDPTQALRYLEAAASKAEVVGSEQVRGESTTRYTVTFDAAKVAAQAPEEFQLFAEGSDLAFPKPADVWIDQQGRLRKIHYWVTVKVPAEEFPAPMTIETTLELYDFGVAVDVAPPPASQVEVIRPDALPPGCAGGKASGKPSSSASPSPDNPQSDAAVCPPHGASGMDGAPTS